MLPRKAPGDPPDEVADTLRLLRPEVQEHEHRQHRAAARFP
jgi:hypothetical protein